MLSKFKIDLDKIQSEYPSFQINIKHPRTGNTLLSAATLGQHLDIIEYLLIHEGIDVDLPNKAGKTALNSAASMPKSFTSVKAALMLIKAGANFNIKDKAHMSPYDYINKLCS